MIERKAYICEYCASMKRPQRPYLDKAPVIWHEKRCFYNPENKTCFTCKHNNGEHKNNLVYLGCDNGLISRIEVMNKRVPEIFENLCPCDMWEQQKK